MAISWKAASQADFALARWGEQVVLYHRPSGLTHFINTATAELLNDLSGRPGGLETLIRRYADGSARHDPAQLQDYVVNLMIRLEELGLVERMRRPDDG